MGQDGSHGHFDKLQPTAMPTLLSRTSSKKPQYWKTTYSEMNKNEPSDGLPPLCQACQDRQTMRFGEMNSLVHDWMLSHGKSSAEEFDLEHALHTMSPWKHAHYGNYEETEYEAEGFTRFGYNGSMPGIGMPSTSTASPLKMKEHSFVDWCWEPNKPRED
jgi:hypothetical protein